MQLWEDFWGFIFVTKTIVGIVLGVLGAIITSYILVGLVFA